MRRVVIAIGILGFWTFDALAVLGDSVGFDKSPQAICSLEIRFRPSSSVDSLLRRCSGTLVSHNQIKTAAHCVHQAISIQASCGQEQSIAAVTEAVHPLYDHKNLEKDPQLRAFDSALLRLETPMNIPPIRIADSIEEISLLLSKNSECVLSAYGINLYSPNQMGNLSSVRISASWLSWDKDLIQLENGYKARVLPGDSGAGLYCQGLAGEWVDIGTVSGHDWGLTSYFASANGLNDWAKVNRSPQYELANVTNKNTDEFLIEEGNEYFIKPFTELVGEHRYATVDRPTLRFAVKKVEGLWVRGHVTQLPPPVFYLCEGPVICRRPTEELLVHQSRLSQSL